MRKDGTAVSIHDVARRAGVSISSVSRALNAGSGSVSADTRSRVLKAAEELNYSPNHIGRSLRSQKTDTFAFVLSNIQNNFFAAVAWELEKLMSDRGYAMILYATNENAKIQDRCLEDARSRQVSGIYFLCAVDSPQLRAVAHREKVVLINRRVLDIQPAPFIGIDDAAAAGELFGAGVRRTDGPIAIVHGPLSSDTSRRRLSGMLARAREVGRPVPPEAMCEASLSMESGYEAATRILGRQPYGAVFCGNDQIAYGVYRRCRELGMRVPDDVLLYGFDDNPLNEWLAPWLSTVRVPHVSFARAALEQMEELLANRPGREIILPYDIILRS